MHPLAEELNRGIRRASPEVFGLLSERGKALYFPKGILSQAAEARQKAHRYDATIGEATERGGPMALRSITSHLHDVDPADALRYAPAPGKPELRRAWQEKLLAENPRLSSVRFGLPIVTAALTHGLSLVADLFVDPGDRIVLPDMMWDNYPLAFETGHAARLDPFPMYAGDRLDLESLRRALRAGPEKVILLLNFPNNPTGYMPGEGELEGIREAVVDAAEAGKRVLVVLDEAYFGLVYDEHGVRESVLGWLGSLHPRVLTVKLDGATKELFVWGLRCGFLTYAPPPCGDPEGLLAALERKTMGAIRAGISNVSHLSQSLVLAALRSPDLARERREKYEILRERAAEVRRVVHDPRYRQSWDVHPFNAGYFMCIRVKGVEAEALRLHLLDRQGVGVIALGERDVRIAFSCLEREEIEPLFRCIHEAILELRDG